MLPHIIFRSEDGYFPEYEYWQTSASRYSSPLKTSGITQPPVHSVAALYIYRNAEEKKGSSGLPEYQRVDTSKVDSEQRSSSEDYESQKWKK